MIPVLRVYLPNSQDIEPYLSMIDKYNVYSNFGKLGSLLSDRISEMLGQNTHVLLTSSGTSALQALLLHYGEKIKSRTGKESIRVAVPCWTFPATVQAILTVGYKPVLVDVDCTGYLDSKSATSCLNKGLEADIILTVIPFGREEDISLWDDFTDKYNIPVIVDAAAAFFSLKPSKTPSAVSMHATKGVSAGEGGFIISTEQELIEDLRPRINFGFQNSRVSQSIGFNGKMSEYNAAVGLASLDNATLLKTELLRYYDNYLDLIDQNDFIDQVEPFSDKAPRMTFNLCINKDFDVAHITALLMNNFGIEARLWWGNAIIDQPISRYCVCGNRNNYPNSIRLAKSVLGIPFGQHLSPVIQKQVISSLLKCLNE